MVVKYAPLSDGGPLQSNSVLPSSRAARIAAGSGLAVCISAFLVWCASTSGASLDTQNTEYYNIAKYQASLGSPYDQPGYLSYDEIWPLKSNWIPFRSSPPPDWLDIIRTAGDYRCILTPFGEPKLPNEGASASKREQARLEAIQRVSHLQNTTILLIGDSVDRNTVDMTARNLAREVNHKVVHYQDVNARAGDERGTAHILELPDPVGLTIANCFTYGADDHDEFRVQPDWFAPGRTEDRIDQLCKPMTDQLSRPVSFIQLHSGLWDLAYFGRLDKRNPDPAFRKADKPLTNEQMDWWHKRMISTVAKIKETWPGVPIMIRGLPRVASPEAVLFWTPNEDPATFTNFFADVRASQLREMQKVVAAEEGTMFFDFAHVWEGYQKYQDRVHPDIYPGGVILGNALLHYAFLASEGKPAQNQAQCDISRH